MTLFRQFLVVCLIAGFGAAAWTAFDPLAGPSGDAARRGGKDRNAGVVVSKVAFEAERVRVAAVGTARATQSASLHPAAAGLVQAINFTAGARVGRGAVLLELDRATEELAVELAQVRLTDAERIFKRLQRLSATGAAAQASLDDARTSLEAARIELKRAEVALEDRFVLAPFGGHIGLTEIDVGDRIGPDTEIATLDDRAALLVRFEVPEALHGRIGVGTAVDVTPWSDAGGSVEGTVVDVGSRVSERTRTFVVRARIANPDDLLRPGMSFRVTLDVAGHRYPSVPEIAIQWGGEGSFLWIVSEAVARRVPVVIVQRQAGTVLVDGELQPGDLVVTEGLHRMREGAPAEIVSAAPADRTPIPARIEGAGS